MKVAVVDSGINAAHSHVAGVAGGVSFVGSPGPSGPEWADVLGHGTAVAGAISERAPEIELYAVRIFDRSFSTGIDRVIRALEWCEEQEMDVVNLSLATVQAAHREPLERVVTRIRTIVAPADFMGIPAWPGSLPGVIGVVPDSSLERGSCRRLAGTRFAASPFPRTLPALSPFENFSGPSFAVANFTGLLCRALLDGGTLESLGQA